ncbi:membrane protein DedA, SNARE-associated domain [Celeribacter marinus]|nr:membrane protein DedA, SNARE-associated domain [Celeribacter marinus]
MLSTVFMPPAQTGRRMTDSIFDAVIAYGIWGVMLSSFLSCLLIPIPTSLMMLAAGALAASGDLDLAPLIAATFLGAVMGDQTGFFIGRTGGARVLARLGARSPARKAVIARAEALVERRGGVGVFFSTWAVAPLGPYVNIAAGAARLPWIRFTVADIMGELIWVNVYVWTGYIFASNITEVSTLMSDVIGLLVATVVAAVALYWAKGVLKAQKNKRG